MPHASFSLAIQREAFRQCLGQRESGAAAVLILNSPWLEHNGPEYEKTALTEAINYLGKVTPRAVISTLNPSYARSLHASFGGEWQFNTAHKQVDNLKVYAGFWRTVRRAHAEIAYGKAHVNEPLLVAHSDRSGDFKNPSAAELKNSDRVLNVEDMKRLAPRLSPTAQPRYRADWYDGPQQPARDFYTRDTIEWALGTFERRGL